MKNRQPLRGGLGSFPTAITRTVCPASGSGDVPSSSRIPSLSKFVLTRLWPVSVRWALRCALT